MATKVFNLEFELVLGSLGGTLNRLLVTERIDFRLGASYLEGQVLEEVRGAAGLVGLGSGTSVDPDTDSGSLSPGRVLGRDLCDIEY